MVNDSETDGWNFLGTLSGKPWCSLDQIHWGGVPVDFIPIVEIAVEVRDIPDVERVQPFCSSDFV
jgi:hypothetical protein